MCADGSRQGSSDLAAVLAGLQGRVASFAPGPAAGALVYLQTGQVWQSLVVACVVGPPTVATGKVIAEWISLLEPPRRWRRLRRRGT